MDLFDVLSMIGGLSLFLFGMNVMGQSLERFAGSGLRTLLGKLTTGKWAGLLTGLGVTAVIQSSSATTVMVVGFVNSGLMALNQAIHVIMGANIGTTVTAWILSLTGIESDNIIVQMFKPTSFTPILALIGVALTLFSKNSRKKDIGTILLGFATLMFGMDTMSSAVKGLADVPAFQQLFLVFQNPILGVLVGAVLTGIIQSSSASVGILQALSRTGAVTYGAAIPIIMGQNIGTCVTALLSSVGTNKNARRAAVVHLAFNVIGTVACLILYMLADLIFSPALFGQAANEFGIAIAHSVFNVFCTLLLLPMTGFLEKLAHRLVPDTQKQEAEKVVQLDERLLATPSIALERCRAIADEMARVSVTALKDSLSLLTAYSAETARAILNAEEDTDRYEDMLGTYLVRLSEHQISESDRAEAAHLLKVIGDFERISDHACNILQSAEELQEKGLRFTQAGQDELAVITAAVSEIVDLALSAFLDRDPLAAVNVEPLEQVIDYLKNTLRSNHIERLQQGNCSIAAGFVWSDLLTNLERTSDHCSNVAGCVLDMAHHNMNLHESLRELRRDNPKYKEKYEQYRARYSVG